MSSLVLIRHGQSTWNLENKFTGTVDVPLTKQGRAEAKLTGEKLKDANIKFHSAFTSLLQRAEETLQIVLGEIHQPNINIHRDAALNERSYLVKAVNTSIEKPIADEHKDGFHGN